MVLVLVKFQDNQYSVNYQIIYRVCYLGYLSKMEAIKWVTLISSNSWILENEISKSPARTSKVE